MSLGLCGRCLFVWRVLGLVLLFGLFVMVLAAGELGFRVTLLGLFGFEVLWFAEHRWFVMMRCLRRGVVSGGWWGGLCGCLLVVNAFMGDCF